MSHAADWDDMIALALPDRTVAGIVDIPNAAIGPLSHCRLDGSDSLLVQDLVVWCHQSGAKQVNTGAAVHSPALFQALDHQYGPDSS